MKEKSLRQRKTRPLVEKTTGTYPNKWYGEYAAKAAEELEIKPIAMGYGDPAIDACIPPNFLRALQKHLELPNAGAYSSDYGEKVLREAYEKFIKKDEGLESDLHISVGTAGGRSIITSTFKALADPGDVILVPDPGWSGYKALARDAKVHLVDISTTSDNHFVPTRSGIERAIEKAGELYPKGKVKLMMINTPHNPTGTVYNEDDLKEIIQVLYDRNITGLVDYTYRAIRMKGTSVPSVHKVAERMAEEKNMPLEDLTGKLVAMQTLGKVTLTPGLRVGYVMATDPDFMGKFSKEKQANDLSGHIFIQTALAEYLGSKGQEEDFANTVSQFEERRNYLLEEMNKLGYSQKAGNIVANPVGFYVTFEVPKRFQEQKFNLHDVSELFEKFPFIRETISKDEYKNLFEDRGYIPSSELFALELADRVGVAVCPGHLFSKDQNRENGYENWCRVALIQPVEALREMFSRINENADVLRYGK
ncbi:MAG: pyridoxal phosphate-dependent aminotransferase [Nanoarchaeota archaeon]|nr:pyridoxal phosphate-dependent aminotransferase [Nanoarchaeota archaeon]